MEEIFIPTGFIKYLVGAKMSSMSKLYVFRDSSELIFLGMSAVFVIKTLKNLANAMYLKKICMSRMI